MVTETGITEHEGEPGEGDPDPSANEPGTGDNERLAYFILMLADDNEVNRWKAAESLGRMGDSRAVEPLIDTLWDDDSRVRLKAAWALGRIGDSRAILPLRRLYRMEKEDMKDTITEAIEEISHQINR